jgi:hypothetical protein
VGFRVAYAGLSLEVQTPMSSAHMQFRSQIGGQQAVIFDLVADLPNYGRWLPDSGGLLEPYDGKLLPKAPA